MEVEVGCEVEERGMEAYLLEKNMKKATMAKGGEERLRIRVSAGFFLASSAAEARGRCTRHSGSQL